MIAFEWKNKKTTSKIFTVSEAEKLAGKSGRAQTLTTGVKIPTGARKIKASW